MAWYTADDNELGDGCDDGHTDSSDQYDSINSRKNDQNSNVKRRSFLKLAGVATSGVVGANIARTATAETTDHGITFDRVVDAVDDLGLDPSAGSPIDSTLDSALESGTLVEFPPGEYLVSTSGIRVDDLDRFGIRGTGSNRNDVRFVPKQGLKTRVIDTGTGAGTFLIENVSFDETDDPDTQMSVKTATTGNPVIKNVEWLGRTPEASSRTGGDFYGETIAGHVLDEDAVATYENVVIGLDAPAYPAEYPNGTMFFRIGPSHDGEVVMRNCHVEGRNSSGTRFTADNIGVCTIENCYFSDNQNASIRFGAGTHPTKKSVVRNCTVEITADANEPAEAVRVGGRGGQAGALIEGCEITYAKDSQRGVIAAPNFGEHGAFTVRNCVVRNEGSGTPTIAAYDVATSNNTVRVENSSFSGSGGGFWADSRPDSVIQDSCMDVPNGSVSGFETVSCSFSGCETPSGSSDSTGDTTDNTDDSADNTDDGSQSDLPNTVSIHGTGTATKYTFTVSDTVKGINSSIEDWDDITDNQTVTAWVTSQSHVDEFAYSGEITEFAYLEGGPVEITRNGESVTTDEFGSDNAGPSAAMTVTNKTGLTVDLSAAASTDSDGEIVAYRWNFPETTASGRTVSHTFASPGTYTISLTVEDDAGATATTETDVSVGYRNSLKIQGSGEPAEYSFEVSDGLDPVEKTIEDWDSVSETGATGWVTTASHVDEFTFGGELTNFEFLSGQADVYVNGKQVDPTTDATSPSELKIQGAGEPTEYSFEVSDTLTPVEKTIEDWDSVSETGATGWVTTSSHVDTFTYTGELTNFEFLSGRAAVYIDGKQVDPTN